MAGSCGADFQAVSDTITRGTAFFTEHFRCATPWVSFGGEDIAALDFVDGPGADVGAPVVELDKVTRGEMLGLMHHFLSRLRRPLRQAAVREGVSSVGAQANAYMLSSIAMLPPRDNFNYGILQGMRRLWFQNIELSSGADPSAGSVDVWSAALRHDGRDVILGEDRRPADKETLRWIMISAADQVCAEEYWSVEIALSQGRTGLAVRTDAVGARELVTALGRSANRRVLVHWVKSHYRQRRGGDPSLVRAHLRGTQFALAKHLYVTVRPSIADIDVACNGARFDVDARAAR